ncbi:MAG: hypothetical protein HXY38_07440 [Chloroflexi bacterium]|nr:hypothetical protein [Chloroflexota bacterium]
MNKKKFIGLILLLTSACSLPASTPEVKPAPTQAPLPTPETVSVTPSLAPTETAVPTPEPPPLYFTDEFDTSSSYWEFTQAGGAAPPTPSFENGALRIDISSPDTWLVGVHNVNSYENVFVRAQTALNPGGSVGLLCRYSEGGWYEFNTSNNGTYSLLLGQWLSPGVAKYIPILNDKSNQLAGASNNEIGLFCQDNFLQLFVNGVMIRRVEVTNYGLAEGRIGISASSFAEIPMSAIFEWVRVSLE